MEGSNLWESSGGLTPKKSDPYRTQLTLGEDRVNYLGDCVTPTVGLAMVKLPLNSIVGTLNAKFIRIDIKDFYLNTPMARREYMHLKLSNLPESVVQQYNLEVKSTKYTHPL